MHRLLHSPLARSLARAFPSLPLALLALGGLLIEAVLLARSTDNVYLAGGAMPLFALAYLSWYWLSLAWVIWLAARLSRRLRKLPTFFVRFAGQAFLGLAVTAAAVVTVASWSIYFQTDRFANLEAVWFATLNPPQTTWLYLGPGERIAVGCLAAGALLFLFALPVLLARLAGSLEQSAAQKSTSSVGCRTWQIVTLVMLLLGLEIVNDPSYQRRSQRVAALKTSLHPTSTLFCSAVELGYAEPIEPCLSRGELAQREFPAWAPNLDGQRPQPSVIIVAIESLRHDVVHLIHQGKEVTPHLNRLARGGAHWTRAYAQSTHSDYADVCIVSSLYPLRTREHHYYRRGDPWPKTLAFDVFKQAGYATAIISSQNEAWGGMDQFLQTPQLDLFYDAKRSGAATYTPERDPGFAYERKLGTFSAGCLYDEHTMATAIDWIEKQRRSQTPFFLSMNFQASHFPYELPEGSPRPFQPCQLDPDVTFLNYPEEKTHTVKNAYYNGIHHCDEQLGRLVAALERLGMLDEVVLVVLGENGEAFHENGSVGHAREPVEPAIHVATVVHAPKYLTAGQIDYPLEHVDLLPTIFGLIGWKTHPNFQGIDALAANRPALDDRYLFFHVNSPMATADAVQWAGRWKLVRNYRLRSDALFDLQADPQEARDCSGEYPQLAARLAGVLSNWRARQLAYYHFPMYYQHYYPPAPPRCETPLVVLEQDRALAGRPVSLP